MGKTGFPWLMFSFRTHFYDVLFFWPHQFGPGLENFFTYPTMMLSVLKFIFPSVILKLHVADWLIHSLGSKRHIIVPDGNPRSL
jgi:hypothetical protein